MKKVLMRSVWGAALVFGGFWMVWSLVFLAVSGRPVLSLLLAALGSATVTLLGSGVHFFELTCFEYRLLWFRGLDSRVPLQQGEQILASELAAYVSEFYIRGGGLYLTTMQLVFVPTRRRWPTFALPADKNLRCEVIPMDLRAIFKGGIRTRLRVRRTGGGEYVFIVWKPSWWLKALRERILQAAS